MRAHPQLSFAIFTGFLVIGYWVSSTLYFPGNPIPTNPLNSSTNRSSTQISTLPNGQRTILLLGTTTDSFLHTHLAGAWLLSYLPGTAEVQLLPVYPAGKVNTPAFVAQVTDTFSFTGKNGHVALAQEFQKLLQENGFWWSGFIIFDQVEIARLLLNTNVADKKVTDDQVISIFEHVSQDPQASFQLQVSLLETACQKITANTPHTGSEKFNQVVAAHLATDLDSATLFSEWEKIANQKHNLACKFPTLEISRSNP